MAMGLGPRSIDEIELNQFPITKTLSWSLIKSPNWATRMQRSVGGRELRTNDYVFPLYTFTLTWEVLRDSWDIRGGFGTGHGFPFGPNTPEPYDELRIIWTFYNVQRGAAIPFMFLDSTDYSSRHQSYRDTPNTFYFATGDGVTKKFQPLSRLLAPVVPALITSVTPGIPYDVENGTGLLLFDTPPAAGVNIGMDYTYVYKVRFATDNLEAENFMYQLWTMKQMKLVSVVF